MDAWYLSDNDDEHPQTTTGETMNNEEANLIGMAYGAMDSLIFCAVDDLGNGPVHLFFRNAEELCRYERERNTDPLCRYERDAFQQWAHSAREGDVVDGHYELNWVFVLTDRHNPVQVGGWLDWHFDEPSE